MEKHQEATQRGTKISRITKTSTTTDYELFTHLQERLMGEGPIGTYAQHIWAHPEVDQLRQKLEWHSNKKTEPGTARDIPRLGNYALAHYCDVEQHINQEAERPFEGYQPTGLSQFYATLTMTTENILKHLEEQNAIIRKGGQIIVNRKNSGRLAEIITQRPE